MGMANMMRREMQEENMGEMMMGEMERLRVNRNASGNGNDQKAGGLKHMGDMDERAWSHSHKTQNGDNAQSEQQAIDPSLNDIHSSPSDWPDDTSCPDPE